MILLAQKQEYRTNITATAATTTIMDSPSRTCSSNSSRRKRQLGEKLLPSTTNAYRLHYCCEHLGKYVGSTKRRITWRFGFTNLHAAGEGKFCRGEEHEIILIWSVVSDKVRVFWNKNNISHLFREKRTGAAARKVVNISWESRSGVKFQIAAHHESKNPGGGTKTSSNHSNRNRNTPQPQPQYDLLLDDISIFSLKHVSELNPYVIPIDNTSTSTTKAIATSTTTQLLASSAAAIGLEVLSETSLDSSIRSALTEGYMSDDPETLQQSQHTPPDDTGLRLSMAGFNSSCELDGVVMDDLASSSLTNTLESLRPVVTSLISNSEDMVSKAIINAFLEVDDLVPHSSSSLRLNSMMELSPCSSSSSISSMIQTDTQIEADTLYDTSEWVNFNVICAPRPDVEEQKRAFLQKQMDIIFMHARHERLTEEAASRILVDVATLLDVPVLSSSIQRDTLIIRDLKGIDADTLIATMMVHEELHEVGVASNRRFAFCRFASERGPLRALAAADSGTLIINGNRPQLSLIQKPYLISDRRRTISGPPYNNNNNNIKISEHHQAATRIPRPIFTRQKSHQRNTISIDTLICESPPFLRLVNDVIMAGGTSSFVDHNHSLSSITSNKKEDTADFGMFCDRGNNGRYSFP